MFPKEQAKRPLIIAEAGVNHDGSLETARQLVTVASDVGADAVKFQTFVPHEVASRHARKARYQQQAANGAEAQVEMLERLALPQKAFAQLADLCEERGLEFISTPFDLRSLNLLTELKVKRLKIGSGDLTNAPLLWHAGLSKRPIILSTGMATLSEIESALSILVAGALEAEGTRVDPIAAYLSARGQEIISSRVTLLQCTTEYPSAPEEVNLRAMGTLRAAFGVSVGLSDHTSGTVIPIAATALGADVIEKHFTLDKTKVGPDHAASLEPAEFKSMVESIRDTVSSLGNGLKLPSETEVENIGAARKSLVAASSIRVGDLFTLDNLVTKRPGDGISALRYYEWIGRRATRDYEPDDLIQE